MALSPGKAVIIHLGPPDLIEQNVESDLSHDFRLRAPGILFARAIARAERRSGTRKGAGFLLKLSVNDGAVEHGIAEVGTFLQAGVHTFQATAAGSLFLPRADARHVVRAIRDDDDVNAGFYLQLFYYVIAAEDYSNRPLA